MDAFYILNKLVKYHSRTKMVRIYLFFRFHYDMDALGSELYLPARNITRLINEQITSFKLSAPYKVA
jgi:hypothetical protein